MNTDLRDKKIEMATDLICSILNKIIEKNGINKICIRDMVKEVQSISFNKDASITVTPIPKPGKIKFGPIIYSPKDFEIDIENKTLILIF